MPTKEECGSKVLNVSTGGGLKDGGKKPPLSLNPPLALLAMSDAMAFGATKYAPWNWSHGIDTMAMLDACYRHLGAFIRGEDCAPDSGVHHLGHALASLAIAYDNLILHPELDDRPKIYRKFKEELIDL